MSQSEEKHFDDLEPLPAAGAAHLPELPHDDLEPLPAGRSAGGSGPGALETRPGAPKGKRELDRAPLELRKASIVLLAGSALPWADPSNLAVGPLLEKLLCYLAVWILYQAHVHKHGGKASGFVASLAKSNAMVPMIVAGLVALVGLAPVASAGHSGGLQIFAALTEKAFLLLGGYTFVHIYDYEHGGKFNPIFPLLFLAPAIGGVASIFTKVIPQFGERAGAAALGAVGAALVALGGLIACHTMWVAMKEAKAHGEAKRAAAQEARRSARESRKGPGAPSARGGGAAKGTEKDAEGR